MNRKPLLLLLFWMLGVATASAEPLRIAAPAMPEGNHLYFHELLIAAFAAAGQPVAIDSVSGPGKQRLKMMLTSGELTVMWMVQSEGRDREFVPVDFALTQGLSGQRVLLIRPADQPIFDNIRSLDDLRRTGFVAGMGGDWVDLSIWKDNDLRVSTPVADWRLTFGMVEMGNRGVDYLPRGLTDLLADATAHPGLTIERRLLLRYDRDARFYLSPKAAALAPVLARGLRRLKENGSFDRLLQKYYGPVLKVVDPEHRLILPLRDDGDSHPG